VNGYKNSLAQVWIYFNGIGGDNGYVFEYDEKNRLRSYICGVHTPIDDLGQIRTFPSPSPTRDGPYPRYAINGDGIEVKFHSTGYPASYKTIVRNRLFGRQIEWDEKGNVISDVDLDIPMPWADVPKPAPEPTEKTSTPDRESKGTADSK
jgi:hypothetical protein